MSTTGSTPETHDDVAATPTSHQSTATADPPSSASGTRARRDSVSLPTTTTAVSR